MDLRKHLRLPSGPVDLSQHDPGATPLFSGGKREGKAQAAEQAPVLAELQERLYAESVGEGGGSRRRLLVVLQGMDTSGKGGTIKHVIGAMNPQGTVVASFKAPTKAELRHDFLWRIERRVPPPGFVGIFDRSHYEDVLIARVRELAPAKEITRRYQAIDDFEARLADEGVTLVKVFLHISFEEQRERLLARLDDPAKHWKFNEGDIDERRRWPEYQRAYELALERCSAAAPWHLVPADRKWYRTWAVGRIVCETLAEMDPQYPRPELDVPRLKARLEEPAA